MNKNFLLGHVKSLFLKDGMLPVYINLYVTSRCNLKCRHCFYHDSLNRPEEMSLAQIEKISKSISGTINTSLTGGEPFLRRDIEKIACFFAKNSGSAIITIPTNGMLSETIIEKTALMASENSGTVFNVFVSLDGLEKTHNKIRGSKKAFGNAMKTLEGLSKIRRDFKNLRVGVVFTINGLNAHETVPLYRQIKSKAKIDSFQVNFLRGNPKNADCPEKAVDEYARARKIIEKDFAEGNYSGYKILGDFYTCINARYKQVLEKTVREKKFQIPCYAGTTNCIIYPDAKVFACETRSDLFFGNLKDFDFDLSALMSTKKSRELAKKIRESKCFCTFECQLTSNVAFNPKELIKTLGIYLKLKSGLK